MRRASRGAGGRGHSDVSVLWASETPEREMPTQDPGSQTEPGAPSVAHHFREICRSDILSSSAMSTDSIAFNPGHTPDDGVRKKKTFARRKSERMWTERLMKDKWLLSRRASRLFLCSVWSCIGLGVALILVLIWYYETLLGRPTPLALAPVRYLIGLLGGLGTLGSFLLVGGMRIFWRRHDNSPTKIKKFWYWVMLLGAPLGCSAYYFLVYREQIRRQPT